MKNLFIFISFLLSQQIFAQPSRLSERIKLVENNLIPYVLVKGFKSWNLIDRMKYYNVNGLSIAVIKDYKIDWAKSYGWADSLKKIPVTTQTMFSAGSISKFLLAVLVMKQVEEGNISLDSPVNNYLRSWKIDENELTQKKPVTLRMLLSHTAGASQTSYFGFTPDKKPLPSIVQILNGEKIAESRKVVINSEPGKEFRYSGGGSMIAQMALMDVSNKSFEALANKYLFVPLQMNNSTFEQPVPEKFSSRTSWAYSNASWFKGMPYVYPQQAAAGLYTTPTDLAKFFIEVQKSLKGKGLILNSNTAKEILTPQANVSNGGYKETIGLGPFLIERSDNKDKDGLYFEFTGVNAGFLAYGIASVEGGNGAVIMLNSGDDQNGIGKELRRAVAKVYHWKNFLPDEVKPISLTESELDILSGRYRMGPNEVLYLRKEGSYLVEKINEGNDIYCFPIAKDTIVFTDFNLKGVFIYDDNHKVSGLRFIWQDKAMPRMKDDEFTAGEYLKQKRYDKAQKGFMEMNLNEYQLTYLAYDLLNKTAFDSTAVKTILQLAEELYPTASIVYARWGDYYLKTGNKSAAIKSYEQALRLTPDDEITKEVLRKLKEH